MPVWLKFDALPSSGAPSLRERKGGSEPPSALDMVRERAGAHFEDSQKRCGTRDHKPKREVAQLYGEGLGEIQTAVA